jgi:acyl-CoA reductase-like NAD-dependent aldehyde dehydrogenase
MAGEKLASVRPGIDIEVTREAVGAVGVITPWNFPRSRLGRSAAWRSQMKLRP